ncbi:MAG TPA: hypothetical protein V6C65_11020 [Allocoleopsis sp.]
MTGNHSFVTPLEPLLEVQSVPASALPISDKAVEKLLDQGGFIASMLSLCLFFWVLAHFIDKVKQN